MKMTLQEKQKLLNIQYVLESLIEDYEDAECESEKYRMKLLLLDFIKETGANISQLKNYMALNEDKFKPFLDLLSDIIEDSPSSYNQDRQINFEIKPTDIVYVVRRRA